MKQRGVYMVITSILIVALLALVGLFLSVSYLGYTQERLQGLANSVSLAAAQGFTEATGQNGPPTMDERTNAALLRANQILATNVVPFIKLGHLGSILLDDGALHPDSAGSMRTGTWFTAQPTNGPDVCALYNGYPCFVPSDGLSTNADALEVKLKNPIANSILAPICNLVGSCNQVTKAEAISNVIPRCFAFLVDASPSSVYDTHSASAPLTLTRGEGGWENLPNNHRCRGVNNIAKCVVPADQSSHYVPKLGVPVFRQIQTAIDCTDKTQYTSAESILWCNMPPSRGAIDDPNWYENNTTYHFKSDYRLHTETPYGPSSPGKRPELERVLVDSLVNIPSDPSDPTQPYYYGEEPFSTFMVAINTSLRALNTTQTSADRALLMGFSGQIIGSYPPPTGANPPQYTTTNDLGPLIQISNLFNRGVYDATGTEIAPKAIPNYLSSGIFPVALTDQEDAFLPNTNPVLAIRSAIQAITTSCPANSIKGIVMFSDGIATCRADDPDTPEQESILETTDPAKYICRRNYDDTWLPNRKDLTDPNDKSVVSRLKQAQISFTMVASGAALDPSTRDVKVVDPPPGRYIDQREAKALGFGGMDVESDSRFFDKTNAVPSDDNTCRSLCDQDDNEGEWYQSCYDGCHEGNAPQCDGIDDNLPSDACVACIVRCQNTCRDSCQSRSAYKKCGKPGYVFREPNLVFGGITMDTNGRFCPLLATGAAGDYEDHDTDNQTPLRLKDSQRCILSNGLNGDCDYHPPTEERPNPWTRNAAFLHKSLLWQSRAEQATQCVSSVMNYSPYVLVAKPPSAPH